MMKWLCCGRGYLLAIVGAVMALPAFAQVSVSVDRLDGSEPGAPAPSGLVVVDVFVDVATTDVWVAAGMRGVALNGAVIVYSGAGGPASLFNPGLGDRFVTCLSKPRLRDDDARFVNAGVASAGRYDPSGGPAVATSKEVNAAWFSSPPENPGSPSFDGYIARVVIMIPDHVDQGSIVVGASAPPGFITLFESRPSSGDLERGTVAATRDVPVVTGLNWGIFGRIGIGACCTDGGCLMMTAADCAEAGGSFLGIGTVCPAPGYVVTACDGAFEDISATGAAGCVGDDCATDVLMGFDFRFFEGMYSEITVSSNGYLTFGGDGRDARNDPIPSASAPNNIICPLWDDWRSDAGCLPALAQIDTRTLGAAPYRRFVAQWTNVCAVGQTNRPATFQAVLYETTNRIVFRYQSWSNVSPTIGVENGTGTAGTSLSARDVGQMSCHAFVYEPNPRGVCDACDCDFNNDGVLNSQDFFDFLSCFFTGCP